jgi:prevent-host-death family protein
MKKASITEAKNRLSALIDGLKRGSPVLIVDRGRPVARLEPVTRLGEGEQDGRLVQLENKYFDWFHKVSVLEQQLEQWQRRLRNVSDHTMDDGHNQLPKVILGLKFTDGIEVVRSQAQAAAA